MDRIDFDTTLDSEELIRIPANLKKHLVKGESVHVTVSPEPPERRTVKRMREHPIPAPGFKPLTREELYDRNI